MVTPDKLRHLGQVPELAAKPPPQPASRTLPLGTFPSAFPYKCGNLLRCRAFGPY